MTIVVVAAVVEERDRFLLTRRLAGTHLEGLWEFPGGKVHAGETHADALIREMQEELGVDATVGDEMHQIAFSYPDRTVHLYFHRCTIQGTPRPLLGQEIAWVPRAALKTLGLPDADRDLIDLLTLQDQ